jgi:hypothetical protein
VRAGRLCLVFWASLLSPTTVVAQAWVVPPGEGSVAVYYQFVRSDVHLNREGNGNRALGSETFHVVALEGVYGLTDRFAVEGSVAWLATKWTGDKDHRHGPVDTGIYHGAVQDLRVVLRYQLIGGQVAVAPFVAVGVPSHAYETRGHSAFGRQLSELQMGLSVGKRARHGAYAHGSFAYSISEGVDGVDLDLDHLNGDVEIGSSLARRVVVRGFATWQVMRDGLQLGQQTEHLELTPVHDRFARASYLQLGGGAIVDVGERTALSVSAFRTASGRNVHDVFAIVSSVTWRFGGGFKIEPEETVTTQPPSRSSAHRR